METSRLTELTGPRRYISPLPGIGIGRRYGSLLLLCGRKLYMAGLVNKVTGVLNDINLFKALQYYLKLKDIISIIDGTKTTIKSMLTALETWFFPFHEISK
jgi:hypothetical protein